jgi:hypothetical protein
MLWPRGVVIKAKSEVLNGILTTYERVSGLRALRHWRNGSLLSEASVNGKDADPTRTVPKSSTSTTQEDIGLRTGACGE